MIPVLECQSILRMIASAVVLTAPVAHAAPIGFGAFVNPLVQTFDGLGLPISNSTPLNAGGTTLATGTGSLLYLTANPFFCVNDCFSYNGANGPIQITLAAPTNRAGVIAAAGGPINVTVSFLDSALNLLGSVTLSTDRPPTNFFGWESSAQDIRILRVAVGNNSNFSFDNLTVEAPSNVPEPATFAMMAAVFLLLGLTRYSQTSRHLR